MKKRFGKLGLYAGVLMLMFVCAGTALAKGSDTNSMARGVVPDVYFYEQASGIVGFCTGEETKQSTNGPYWFEIRYTSAPNQIIVNTQMHNSNHEARGEGQVLEGTINSIPSNGTAGYLYHGNVWRQYWYDPAVFVEGWFSPDNY